MKKYYLSLLLIALSTLTLVAQVPSYVPTSGLVGWWPFSGNANDLSGNGYHLTNSNVSFGNDRNNTPSSAAYFSGNNSQLVSQTTFSQFSSSPLQTYSFWFKNVSSNWRFIVNYANASTTRISMLPNTLAATKSFAVIGSSGCLNCGASGGGYDFPTPGIETGWHHFVVAVSATTYTVFKDGAVVGTQPHTGFNCLDASFRFILGNDIVCAPEFYEMFLDDVGVWNRTLTNSEISALFTTTPAPTPPTVAITPAATSICSGTSTTLSASANAGSSVCASSQLPTSLQSGLVGYWPFCGNANDESGNGNNGTAMNGVALTTDRFGNSNSAYSFDGVDDYIEVINSTSINSLINDFSLSIWYSTSTSISSDNRNLLCKSQGAGPLNKWIVMKSNGTGFYPEGIGLISNPVLNSTSFNGFIYTSNVVPNNQWHNISIVKESNNLKIYINGSLIQTSPITNSLNLNTANLRIGGDELSSVNNDHFWSGLLDDIGIWNRALTTTEIQQLYTLGNATYSWSPGGATTPSITVSPTTTTTYTCIATANGVSASASSVVTVLPAPTITATNTTICAGQSTTLTAAASGSTACPTLTGTLSTGLVGFWPFCGNANDASGNGNNGTVNGATLTTDRFGNANSAYSFDGVSTYIDVAHSNSLNLTNSYTVEFWVKNLNNTGGWYSTVSKDNWFASQGFINYIAGTNFASVNCAASNHAITNLPINTWIQITITYENGTLKIYKNGILVAQENQSFSNSTSSLRFGARHQNDGSGIVNYLDGQLDDIAIWNRALTISEIQQLYNQGQTTYSWSPGGATTPSITVSPTTTTTYTCTVTDASGNSCASTQTITVIPFTGVNAGADQSICNGGSVTLNATGASTYSWNNSVQNGVAFSPLSSGTYIVTGTQNGCTDADTVAVTVVADPTITSPAAASYCQNGGTVTPLSVSVAGGIASAYTYQWYANTTVNNFGGTPVLGATTSFYTPPINTIGTTFYYCTVTQGAAGNGCLATSGANSIVVNAQPAITSQPVASQNGCVGAALTPLTLAISGGNGTPTYQWYANTTASTSGGVFIPGATNSSFTPSNTTAGTYYFYCVASFPNATSCATKTSAVATVTLINDPIFTIPPTASQSVCVGGTIPALTFNSSGGSGTASYQWYAVNGSTYTTILGATNPSYTPPIFNVAGTYAYAVAISQTASGCASGFSPLANVTVVADPNVSSPSAANYCQGGLPSNPLTVTATAGINSGYAYQWFSNGSNNNTSGIAISGATAAAYTPPTSAVGTLYYYCQVNQGAGCSVNSTPASITVVPGPAFTSQPLPSQTVCAGASLNALSVAYSGGTGTPTYQWYSSTTNNNLGGTPVAGASNASFTPNPNVVGLNYYYCQVSFAALTTCASISSNVAQVNVISNPVFSSSPLANQTICQGAGAQTLSFATSGGTGSASFQWYNVNGSNYTPILGATGLTYTPPSNLPIGTYNYAVAMNQVASGCSTGFSSNAQLVVLAQPVLSAPIGGVYCQGGIGQALSVSVSGGNGASNYQWYQNTANTNSGGTAIAGATSSSYLPSLMNFGTLYYYCVLTQNAGCAASSSVATVVSNPNPVISTQPTAIQTICVGSAPTPLSTSYTGGVGTPSYQWYVNNQNTTLGGSAIAGANASTYLPGNQVGLGSNYYYCVVTLANSSCLQATTNIATVNTVANPIVNGPTSTTYCQSTSVAQALSVSASGGNGTSYTYLWYSNVNNANFGGNPILGANNPNYTPNINGSSLNYYCVVTQPGGCQTTSAVASIEIVPTPGVSSQPLAGQTICVGGTPQALSIAIVGGVSNPSFQWYSNTVNTSTNASLIPNASSATYTPNTASNTGTTYYFCQVSFTANSACPTLVSNAASIIVASDPVVSNPSNANYCQNATSVTPLSVTASGGINTSYTYQWYSNTNNSNVGGTPIAGANSSSYIPLVNQIGTNYYYCEVTQGSGCTALSGVSTISVGTAASINQQPISSQNLCLGQNASTLTVGVSAGNYSVSYQWYSNVSNNNFGGSVIVGATNAFYTPPSTALGTKYYYCVIAIAGGGCGNLTSNTAAITVLNAPTMFQPNSQSICCQSSTTPIVFVGNASSYSWTASSSSPLLTGFSSAGNGNIPSNVLTNNSTTPQNIVYLVTPSNQGCAGTPVQFNISVLPCLSVSVPADQYYCAGESVPAYVFSGVGQTYSWVNTNTTTGLQNAGINFVPNFVAQNTTPITQVSLITVTPNFMGCAGTPQSFSISVYPLPLVDAGIDQEVCSGGSVTLTANGAPNLVWDNGILNGQTFVPNASTTYTVTGTDANGCQNQDDVFVQVNQPTSATLNINACDSYTLNGQTYTQSGTYDQLLSNSAGCDSSLTLNLSLNFSPNQPNIYVQNQVNLSTDLVPGLTYQWITCSDLTPISGQTAITYNPTSNGVYAVVVTNGCGSDTSLCTSITTIGLEEHLSSQILLYPNPNNGVFTLEMPQVLIGQTIQLFDMAGRLIEESTALEMKQHIELKDVATGSYWLRIGSEIPMQLVKN